MDKIEKLIKELCPNGVERHKLGDICDTVTDFTAAGSFASNAKNVKYKSEPDFAQLVRTTDLKSKFSNTKFVYVDEHAFNYLYRVNINEESIILPNVGNCGEVYYVMPKDLPYAKNVLGPNALLVRSSTQNNRFLYHLFQERDFQRELGNITSNTGQSKFNKTNLKKIVIPIPPLKIQEEIVKILDKFTDYVTELTTELTLRQKQYNYYRDKLLSFEGEKVQHVKLSTVCQVYDGTHQTPRYRSEGVPFVSVENIKNLYKTSKYISIEDFEKYKIKPRINDILMTRIGDVGTCTVVDRDEDLAYYVSLALIRPNIECINPYFLRYFIESRHGRRELNRRILHTAVPIKINMGDIGKIMISLPSMEIQTQIVKILDNFNHLTSNISNGLPKEIELRQKQYEYYRDKLLSFD